MVRLIARVSWLAASALFALALGFLPASPAAGQEPDLAQKRDSITAVPWDESQPALPEDLPPPDSYVWVEQLPQVQTRVPAVYPRLALEAGVEGTVMVQALVGTDGQVKETRIVHTIPMLDAAALEAVRHWIFEPARTDNRPVAVWVAIPVRFSLHGASTPPWQAFRDAGEKAETEGRTREAFDQYRAALLALDEERVPLFEDWLRQRIVRLALKLDSPPLVPAAARIHLARGDSLLGHGGSPEIRARAIGEYEVALRLAPWWADGYRRLAAAQEQAGAIEATVRSLHLYTLAAPDAPDREQALAKIQRLMERAGAAPPR